MLIKNPDYKKIVLGLPKDAFVVDVGGASTPLGRANKVVDIQPMNPKIPVKKWGGPRLHTAKDWIVMDICSDPLPFSDKEVDFLWCARMLEDIRDPIFACKEISRVAKSGFIELPSRARESQMGLESQVTRHGKYYCGHIHHRWFCELIGDELVFTLKTPMVQVPEFREYKYYKSNNGYLSFYWEGDFRAREKILHSVAEYFQDAQRFLGENKMERANVKST